MTATQARRIDEVAVVFNGKTPSKSEQRDGGHPVLKIKDVDALGRFRGMFSGYVDADLARKHVKQQLAGGETLVLNAAHSATHVASKTFYADQDVAGSLATGEWLIEPVVDVAVFRRCERDRRRRIATGAGMVCWPGAATAEAEAFGQPKTAA